MVLSSWKWSVDLLASLSKARRNLSQNQDNRSRRTEQDEGRDKKLNMHPLLGHFQLPSECLVVLFSLPNDFLEVEDDGLVRIPPLHHLVDLDAESVDLFIHLFAGLRQCVHVPKLLLHMLELLLRLLGLLDGLAGVADLLVKVHPLLLQCLYRLVHGDGGLKLPLEVDDLLLYSCKSKRNLTRQMSQMKNSEKHKTKAYRWRLRLSLPGAGSWSAPGSAPTEGFQPSLRKHASPC